MSEYELYHYGVKGMKWGVRKKSPYISKGQIRKNAKAAYKESYKADRKNKVKRSIAKENAKKAKQNSIDVDNEYNLALQAKERAGIARDKLADFAVSDLRGKTAFTYKGKEYKYTGTLDSIEMIGSNGKSMGSLTTRSIDIDIDTWNKIDDKYIKWSKI